MCIPLENELSFRVLLVTLIMTFGVIRGNCTHKAEARESGFMRKGHKKETRTYERRCDVVIQDLAAIAWAIPMSLYIPVPSWRAWAALSSLPLLSSFSVFQTCAWMSWIGVALGVSSLVLLI